MLALCNQCLYYACIQESPGQRANADPGPESTTAVAAMNPQTYYPAIRLWTQEESSRHEYPIRASDAC